MRNPTVFCSLLCIVACGFFVGCDKSGADAAAGQPKSPPPPVTVATVLQQDVPVQLAAIAATEPLATVTIRARVAGQLSKVAVNAGQDVKQNDLLFEIDSRPFEIDLHEAQARLDRDIALAKNAQIDADRFGALVGQNVATREEADKAQATAQAAQATVRGDQASIETAKLQIDYCQVRAPLDGRAGKLLSDRGNIVKADETDLLTINQIAPIYVSFALPEIDLGRIRQYFQAGKPQKVTVIVPPDTEPSETGTLSFIDNVVDRDTGTIRLRATFDNTDRRLWPGQFVQAALDLTLESNALLIPSAAVQTGQQGPYVFVVKNDSVAEMRPVKVRRIVGEQSVLEPGAVTAGERVITDGQLRVVSGKPVEVKSKPTSTPASQPTVREVAT